MSEIKTGSRVRFLNAVGGGTVIGFKGKDQVLVEGDDGFAIPVLLRECVVIGASDKNFFAGTEQGKGVPSASPYREPDDWTKTAKKKESIPQDVVTPPRPDKVTETPQGERLNLFLAYLPVDPKAPTLGIFEAWLVNNSNYHLFFNYTSRQNNTYVSRLSGEAEPNTSLFMEEFGREELNNLERICVQLIAFKKGKPYRMKNAISAELCPDTTRFFKKHCFTENDFFDQEALLFPVVTDDVPARELLVSAQELKEAMQQKQHQDSIATRSIEKGKSQTKGAVNQPMEIDLHIHQLTDNTAGLSNADMLGIQLDAFRTVMTRHSGQKGQKIVFIHGKGNGVLRKAIEEELGRKWRNCSFQDASFREYGFGATLVIIR